MDNLKIYTNKNVAISGMDNLKVYTNKNVAISDMQKLKTMCKNVEISEAQIQRKKINVGGFVHMKEGTTAVTGSYKMKLLQSYRRWRSPSYEACHKEG